MRLTKLTAANLGLAAVAITGGVFAYATIGPPKASAANSTATLATGGVVWCGTFEDGVAVGEMVTDARDLGRRLARAAPGPPHDSPDDWPIEVVQA